MICISARKSIMINRERKRTYIDCFIESKKEWYIDVWQKWLRMIAKREERCKK